MTTDPTKWTTENLWEVLCDKMRTDPVVYRVMTTASYNNLNKEQTALALAVIMTEMNEQLTTQMRDMVSNQYRPVMFETTRTVKDKT
jgi:hypothetical protein